MTESGSYVLLGFTAPRTRSLFNAVAFTSEGRNRNPFAPDMSGSIFIIAPVLQTADRTSTVIIAALGTGRSHGSGLIKSMRLHGLRIAFIRIAASGTGIHRITGFRTGWLFYPGGLVIVNMILIHLRNNSGLLTDHSLQV